MKDTEYGNIKIPMGTLEQIDEIVANQSNGYRSRNEACVDAIRRFVRKFKGEGNETHNSKCD